MKIDYLIVGQGLAGSLLAWEMLARGKRILVVDRDEEITSSKVAAGLVTPLTGSRPSMTPAFEERLLAAKEFYWNAEEASGVRFFYHLPIAKLFRSESDAASWSSCDLSDGTSLHPYLGKLPLAPGLLHAEHGGLEMTGGGWLDVPAFLEATRQHLLERASYAIGRVNSDDVTTTPTSARWRNIEASKIIFAEGWRNSSNRFFDWIKMHSALGDILEVKIPALADFTRIVNRGAWLLPLGGGRFKTGSNYRHEITSTVPDEVGRGEISEKLKTVTPLSFEIIGHQCAVRPIIKRSQIFCGVHPAHETIAFFNGLGSKGVLNGPWHAERLAAHLEGNIPLPHECDLRTNLI